ncbi:Zn-ribbon domain-containing OB-fold protein [Gordonia rubripertincta]|uniref:OB-fold domain-containing protein n=1 Tax=Gordonia rubripertincta TaxID=36822 RepID=A0ABT4MNR0_GORRU|nr:OB-fold domain-containing protein [Gordonia rubripertincta]MCZ4548633.1 OB-fold domain-containing protein [Gordonia rubripertincta]
MLILRAPDVDDLSRPFWEGCREHELRLQRCLACLRFIHHPERECPFCHSAEFRFEAVEGGGVVDTFTEIHRSFVPEYRGAEPYVVGWIALAGHETVRMFGRIVRSSSAQVAIGSPVHVAFDTVPGFGEVPYFVLG